MRSIPILPLLVVALLTFAMLLTTGLLHVVRRSRYNREMAAGVAYCALTMPFTVMAVLTGLHREMPTPALALIAGAFVVQMLIFDGVLLKDLGSGNTGFAILNATLVLLFAEMSTRTLMYSLRNQPPAANALHGLTLVADAIIALILALAAFAIAVEIYHSIKKRRLQNRQRTANRQPAN